jgi:hypothetical protein
VSLDPREVFEILEKTPQTLGALLGGLTAPWLEATDGPDTFSPLDVLGHLIHGEETDWVPRIRIILEHGEAKPFEPFDRLAFREKWGGRSSERLLTQFAAMRQTNLEIVRGFDLDAAALRRCGTHPALGRVTLAQLLAAWAVHDLGHIKQVVRVMAKRYREAVGPWREYLTILDRA